MDRLEVQGHAPNSFPEFEKLFINKYAPIDNKNIARDKNYASYGNVALYKKISLPSIMWW